ncbi:hypothetical protein [Umezawaea tangerina]|uniref:Uncharacterized protein n=1 Tax=Umezawaea tangerina TaxID=84725 RepID=A0A2T0T4H4_9PSEU|nr:hypothetical protein [Umezawaea tangerina]PRY40533.1 hypothetical protein CLV43_106270 [Umezawaea tangerina]
MATNVLGTITGSTGMGRYFTVVSALPSASFVSYVYLLVESGAWSGPVRFDEALRGIDLKAGVLLTLVSFAAAVTLHPLQFALIQLLEGYWGRSTIARRLAALRVLHHQRVTARLDRETENGTWSADAHAAETVIRQREAKRLRESYPTELDDILPTRLGNVLRRYEMSGGSPYGIDLIATAPRISMVAQDRELQYVADQRTQLELAVRVAVLAMIAAMATVVVLWRHGAWLLLAIGPYTVAYLAYRGAVVAAHEYGTALTVMVELNRFALYERLHLKLPDSLEAEKHLNPGIMRLLRSKHPITDRDSPYRHPDPAPSVFPPGISSGRGSTASTADRVE